MDVCHILTTHDVSGAGGELVLPGCRLVFSRLDLSAPPPLAGSLWAFVDWLTVDMAGIEVCRRMRCDPGLRSAHITLVLDSDDMDDRRRALRAGADDYMVGPLDRQRIVDRVSALKNRRQTRNWNADLVHGDLTIDLAAMQARWAGQPVPMPPVEFQLLRFLSENPNRVLTREDVLAGLEKADKSIDVRTVDAWIGRLRRALRAAGAVDPVRTVRSVGYVLDTP